MKKYKVKWTITNYYEALVDAETATDVELMFDRDGSFENAITDGHNESKLESIQAVQTIK